MTLYELTDNYLQLLELMENGTDEELIREAIENLDDQFEDKAESYAILILEMEAEAEKCQKEIERLTKRMKNATNSIEHMKNSLTTSMLAIKKTKMKTERFTFSVKGITPSVVIRDEEAVPDAFKNPQPPKIDKKKLKKYMVAHGIEECDYAYLKKDHVLIVS